MPFTEKQTEYLSRATHRWNIKTGAVRSGKTYLDFFLIPVRIRAADENGLVVLLGNTVGTLCRNILDPMRNIWGAELVGYPKGDDSAFIFGRKCWLIGASRAERAEKLQGAGIAYAYGDEITTWSEEVFEMLKSRLDRESSRFDGTCNPTYPSHWFKKFLDGSSDIFHQHYTIDDNPFLPPQFVASLKNEYLGTPYYDRFILGKWVCSDGLIYPVFAANPEKFVKKPPKNGIITVGIDFGGNSSATAFIAVLTDPAERTVYVLKSVRLEGIISCAELNAAFASFYKSVRSLYGTPSVVFCDSAEQILIRSLKQFLAADGIAVSVKNARKNEISKRIMLVNSLISGGRLFLSEDCKSLKAALLEAMWEKGTDRRLDNGTTDIDSLDAFEYAIEGMMREIM